MNTLRQPLFREATAALLAAVLLLQSATAVAPGPAWWGTQSVADPHAVPDDFAAANIGQLKYLAAKAAAAMNAELPGGAGAAINTLVAGWNAPAAGVARDDYVAVNQGQLKHVAAPFYDRLGLPHPWAGGSGARDDYQLVNLGQLKHVFSFELKFRALGQGPVQIPAQVLQAALAAWNALPVKPVGSSADDLDGDGIANLQEYLMGSALFDPNDLDGDRIADAVEEASGGVLSKLCFADAVRDHDGDGVMNFEEVLLGLNLSATTTSGRADGFGDVEVLAWGLAAQTALVPSTDAVRALWEHIDMEWLAANWVDTYVNWLVAADANSDDEPDGLAAFREDVMNNFVWWPWNPDVWSIQNPPLAHDAEWNPIDMDGDGVDDFDRDYDGQPDLWEYRYSLNLRDTQDAWEDADSDGLLNREEFLAGTNPRLADTDGDEFDDGLELAQGGDALDAAVVPPLTLAVAGGTHHYIYPGQSTPALAVKVTQGGLPVAGVAVTFALTEGDGRLHAASSLTGNPGGIVSLVTAANGTAAVTYEAGAQAGSASISASATGVTGSASFGVSVVALPVMYGGSGGGSGGGYGGAATQGAQGPVAVPPRSTAASAVQTAAATADGFRIRVLRRFGTDQDPADGKAYSSLFPEYLLQPGLTPVVLVGYQTPFEVHSWHDHAKLELAALPLPPPPKKPVIPEGARRYLVLVYQGENVEPGTLDPPKHAGVLTFQYTETGAPLITLTGGIPDKFIKLEGPSSVVLEPPLATGPAERVWVSLIPIEVDVNDTSDVKDDIVRKEQKIGTTAWRQWIACTVRIPENGPAKTITSIGITAEDGTMKFAEDFGIEPGPEESGEAELSVNLDDQGWARFWITGITQSANKGDAKLQIRKNGTTGNVLAIQSLTVFWFETILDIDNESPMTMSGDPLSTNRFLQPQYDISVQSRAIIKPKGLNNDAPQIKNYIFGIVQNMQSWRANYKRPPSVIGPMPDGDTMGTVKERRVQKLVEMPMRTLDVIMRRDKKGTWYRPSNYPLYLGDNPNNLFGTDSSPGFKDDLAKYSYSDGPRTSYEQEPFTYFGGVKSKPSMTSYNVKWPWNFCVQADTFTVWSGIQDIRDTKQFIPIKQSVWYVSGAATVMGPQGGTVVGPISDPTDIPVVDGTPAFLKIQTPVNQSSLEDATSPDVQPEIKP